MLEIATKNCHAVLYFQTALYVNSMFATFICDEFGVIKDYSKKAHRAFY